MRPIRSRSDCESSSFHSFGKRSSTARRHARATPPRRPRDDLTAAAGVLDVGLELLERGLDLGRRLRIALGQLGLEVRERGGRAIAEGDRLLDLERDRHPTVIRDVAVLVRHQVEERTSCAARRSCSSGVKGAATKPSSTPVAASAAAGKASGSRRPARASSSNAASPSARAAARARARLGNEVAKPRGLREVSARRASSPRFCGLHGLLELFPEARLVGVEQVLLHPEQGFAGSALPARELA